MKRRIDVDKVCLAYNNARDENKGKVGSPSWAFKILKEKGISINLAKRILREPTLVIYSKRENAGKGNYKCCTFPFVPVHRDWIENWLYPKSKNVSKSNNNAHKKSNDDAKDEDFEMQCKKYLEELGYTVKKMVLDEKMLKEKYPEIWEKCLVEEI